MTAYSYFDISKAESLAKSLPLEQSFESSINAETLERLPVRKLINRYVLFEREAREFQSTHFLYISITSLKSKEYVSRR